MWNGETNKFLGSMISMYGLFFLHLVEFYGKFELILNGTVVFTCLKCSMYGWFTYMFTVKHGATFNFKKTFPETNPHIAPKGANGANSLVLGSFFILENWQLEEMKITCLKREIIWTKPPFLGVPAVNVQGCEYKHTFWHHGPWLPIHAWWQLID